MRCGMTNVRVFLLRYSETLLRNHHLFTCSPARLLVYTPAHHASAIDHVRSMSAHRQNSHIPVRAIPSADTHRRPPHPLNSPTRHIYALPQSPSSIPATQLIPLADLPPATPRLYLYSTRPARPPQPAPRRLRRANGGQHNPSRCDPTRADRRQRAEPRPRAARVGGVGRMSRLPVSHEPDGHEQGVAGGGYRV